MTQLVQYIVQVYAVSWFEIKRNGKFEMQPVFIFDMIQRMKLQSPTIQKALENLKFNAFGLLPENVLYSMICSDNMMVRRLAIMKILSIRKPTTTKRLYKIPVIKYDAAH